LPRESEFEESDTMRSMLRELRTNNSKLLSQAEYNEERIQILSANTRINRTQITALEEKSRNYKLTIFKHEQTIMHLKDEVLVAQDKLYKTEKSLEKLKRNKEEMLNVTMIKVDLCVRNKGPMEIVNHNDQDTRRPVNISENNKDNFFTDTLRRNPTGLSNEEQTVLKGPKEFLLK
jgi:nucleoprotein TPR